MQTYYHNLNRLKYLFTLFITVWLSGCQPYQSLPTSLSEYQERVSRVLAQPEMVMSSLEILPFPDANQRAISIPSINIPLSDFYDITGCELAPLIAQRNTALGKVEPPSRRLVYEATLLHTLEQCFEQATSNKEQEAIAPLRQLLTFKQTHYPSAWADLIQNSQSVRLGLSFSSGYIEGDASDGFVETTTALRYLSQIRQQPPLDIAQLEAHLATLDSFRLPARLYRSVSLMTVELKKMNEMLAKFQQSFSCGNPAEKTQITILNNVMKQFFIQQLQPIASKINRYQQSLSPLLQEIVNTPSIDVSMQEFHATQSQSFVTYQNVFRQHVNQLQQLLATCGLRPTAN